MEDDDRNELLDALLARLKEEGVPQGTWLIEIALVREALRAADSVLRRLEDALIRDASGSRSSVP
jgi:hypothetical protein